MERVSSPAYAALPKATKRLLAVIETTIIAPELAAAPITPDLKSP